MSREECVYFLVLALRWLQDLLDIFLDATFDYKTKTGRRAERQKAEVKYEFSAQVVDIRVKGAINAFFEHMPEYFLYTHNRYASPDFVLEHDHVTLMSCSATHAVFCVSDPAVCVYDMHRFPFVMHAQYLASRQLVLIPHWAFYQLFERAGDPRGVELIGYGMTARSGSTLLSQMFSRLPDTVAMSEPWSLYHAHVRYCWGDLGKESYPELVRGLLRLQCKPFRQRCCKRIVIKFTTNITAQQEIVSQVMPGMKLFFNTRHPKKSVVSYKHTILDPAFDNFWKYLYPLLWFEGLPFDYDSERLRALKMRLIGEKRAISHLKAMAYIYSGSLQFYFSHRRLYRCCVLYEDLSARPRETAARLFAALGISADLVPLAVTALDRHSQGHIFGDPSKVKREEVTHADIRDFNQTFEDVGIALHTEMPLEEFKKMFS